MTPNQIKHMVNRFLGWKLPPDFSPDAGISFKAAFNEGTAFPMKHEPSGTNLFDATQAEAMVRYMVEGMPVDPKADRAGDARVLAEREACAKACEDYRLDEPDRLCCMVRQNKLAALIRARTPTPSSEEDGR